MIFDASALKREDCTLRSITYADLELVRSWRNSERIRKMMLTDQIISQEEHLKWFESLGSRQDMACRLFEIKGVPFGYVSFKAIDRSLGSAEWGFYRGMDSAPSGAGLAMGVFALNFAFDTLHLTVVTGKTFLFNSRAIRYHESLAFERVGILPIHRTGHDSDENLVAFEITIHKWHSERIRIETSLFASPSKVP